MNKLVNYKKPELVVLNELKKIMDYEPEEKLTKSASVVKTLILNLGVGNNSDENQHIQAIKYINENCKDYSFEEIIKAFQLAIEGKLNIQLFQQLNSLVIGNVLREFEVYKRRNLQDYNRKNAEIKKVNESNFDIYKHSLYLFNKFKKENRIDKDEIFECVYEYLYNKKLLPKHTPEFKAEFERKGIAVALFEVKKDPIGDRIEFQKVVNDIKRNPNNSDTVRIIKRLIIDKYFRNLLELNAELEDELTIE